MHGRCLVALALTLPLASACWEGEPYEPVVNPTAEVTNDLTYTAVTGNVANVSAVAIELHGFSNSDEPPMRQDINDQGFLISRFAENPSYEAALVTEPGQVDYVRRVQCQHADSNNAVAAYVTNLLPATEFYFRTYVVKREKVYYGVVKRFRTTELHLSIYDPPTHIGLLDVDLTAKYDGLRDCDYSEPLVVRFTCQDAERNYDRTQVGDSADVAQRKTTHFADISPGVTYQAYAYFTVESDFWCYAQDNPDKGGGNYVYGERPEDIVTHKYRSSYLAFSANTLTGVVSYPSNDVKLDYDVAVLRDNYFVLPSDTFPVEEYGIALVGDDGSLEYHPGTSPLREGNRYDVRLDNLQLDHPFKFISYVKLFGLTFRSDTHENGVVKFRTADYTPVAVDLELSVLWAKQNVGAPDEYSTGLFYSWGELEPKSCYDDTTYTGPPLSVWNISGTEWDVAHVKWGGKWRMPTAQEVYELLYGCDWEWDSEHQGLRVTSYTQESIFLPACGEKSILSYINGPGTERPTGRYWTGERARDSNEFGLVYQLAFFYGTIGVPDNPSRWVAKPTEGFTIRPVCDR